MLVCLLASAAVHAAQIKEAPKILAPGETRLHHRIDDVSFTPSDGKLSRLSDYSGKAIVIAFTSPTCPVALRYRPRLTELTERFKGKVEFLIINSKADSNTAITAALFPSSTTEVFLLDAARTVLYRGAVDDQYGLGYQLDAPRHTFLVDAIGSLLASRPIATPATTAPGCEIEGKTNPKPSPITFHSRISRIIQYNCQECHRPGEPAPFNLLTYDDAKSHAKTIKRVVERKIMPPWFAEGGHWANDRRLSDADRNDLLAWIAAGSPEGDPSHAPLARTWETGWRIGKPDAVFEVPRPIKVAAQGAMPYQEVVVLTGLPEDKWVKAVEIRTSQPQVTHHILVFEVYPSGHPRDAKTRPNHLAGLAGYFAGMVPGQGHIVFPENTAKFLPKGAGLRFQIHYTPNGAACEDKPKIGLLYADVPPKHEVLTRSVATTRFLIPANESNYAVTATKTFTEPTRIFSFNAHSHVRGKAFKYELVMPDGARTTLLDLPHYDFNWQIEYRLKEPLDVPIRSKLVVTAWYDNSKDNPANPDPNKDIGWGDQTWDEMMIGYYTRHSLAPTRVGSTQVAATAAPPVVAEGADSKTGILKTPDGKPLPDADVYLSTTSAAVPIYSAPSPKVAVTRTGADGRFSFPLDPKNRAVIVVHEKGYGQITVAELVKRHELTLQPWGRVEGTLREGSKPLAGETIHLSRAFFGSKIERETFRTHHDTTTETDAAGHYVFPRVAPGDAWISWLTGRRQRPGSTNKYDVQTRYVDIQPGQSLIADIGGRGRPITGRAVLAESDDAQVRHFGSVWPKPLHQMRRPPNWSELSTEEKTAWTAAWEKSPDAKLYNQEKCEIDFRPAADGTFIVPDVPAGEYRIWLGGWDAPTAPMVQISRGDLLVTVPEMPGGRSDEPLDVGEIKTYSFRPLRTGEPAPLFETSTFDGKPLKLADFKGKHVLLSFWRSDDAKSLADMAHLKTAQAAWGKDQRFVLIGLNLDGTLAAAQRYATDNKLTWVQCYLGERSDVPMRYHLLGVASAQTWDSGPKSMLIGPDGLMIRSDVRGPKIATALEAALSTRVKKRITQPGDLIFASSGNSRGSEGVANAIDNDKNTKYLNWDSGRDGNQIGTFSPSGFAVQPAVGPTVVTGMGIQAANDVHERDPDVVVLEGSNDTNLTSYESGTWTPITTISNIAAGFTARFESQEFFFSNSIPYRNYRWRVEATRTTPNRCCMQVAEVWLTGSAPSNQAGSPAAAGLNR